MHLKKSDPVLRAIIERDYKKLSQTLMPDCAWKNAVVIAGSILEAVLYDLLTRDPARTTRVAGYDSEAAFSRAFKKAFGAAPATWRRSNS